MRFIAGLHARMEHADIRRRTQRGRRARVAGSPTRKPAMLTGAWPLYGCVWGDPDKGARTHYVVDPETGWVVVFIFESVADGMPIRQLSRELEERGIPTPFQVLESRGMLPAGRAATPSWRRSTIWRMLWHPAYWGAHSAYRLQRTAVKVRPPETGITRKVRHVSERDADDPARVALPDTCPALVTAELAARVHARLRENKLENPGRNRDPAGDALARPGGLRALRTTHDHGHPA